MDSFSVMKIIEDNLLFDGTHIVCNLISKFKQVASVDIKITITTKVIYSIIIWSD